MSGIEMFGLGGSNTSSKQKEQMHAPGDACGGGCDANSSKDHPIFAAVRSGLLVPVQTIAEDGPEVFSMRDEKGHTPAHWACLGGHTTILRFIMDCKGPLDEPSYNDLGARPIHWACVNGHISVVDLLLQFGVNIDVADNKGCTPLIVAAQYGHTMLGGYLMGKGSRLQMVDKDGDNALHWASFKGFSELMRLLIYTGFNPRQRDNYGQTPLHLACISGNLTAVTELCEQDGVELDVPDKNGKTPLILARGRKYDEVCDYLQRQIKMKNSLLPKIDLLTIAFGPPGNSKSAILFFIINVVFWGYPMYVFKCLPYTWADLHIIHILFFMGNVAMWFCLFHASTTDPGYLPRNVPEYDLAIKQVAQFDEWRQNENPLSRLCHTCRTVKPLRAKHCRICNRCVLVFDHHCPYIYNCVGYYNRPWFYSFVVSVLVIVLFTDFFIYYLVSEFGWDWVLIIGAIEAALGTIACSAVTFIMSFHAARNITANERVNYKRYHYLKDGKGAFHNPFDKGTNENCRDFFHLRRRITENDVDILNI